MSPLLNFCEVLVEVLKIKDFDSLRALGNIYMPILMRDNTFIEYLDKVSIVHFEKPLKPPNPLQQMMDKMMGGN